jgi:hypothetical protein
MPLLPDSTNAQYRGATASAWFLCLLGLGSIIPGVLHYALPDGGAGTIAGLDLEGTADVVIGVFAWMGATQIAYGIAQTAVALRYRTLTPLFLLLALVERTLGAVAAWITKAPDSAHHPPNHYGVVIALPFILLFLVLSLRARPAKP